MNTMTLSPMQQGGIARGEFSELKSYINDGFELTNEHIDNVEIKVDRLKDSMNAQFKSVNERIETVESKVDNLKRDIMAQFNGIHEHFQGVNEQFARQNENIANLTKLVTKIATKVL